MGNKLSEYDRLLIDRLENIRINNRYSQEKMAELMGVDTKQYRRYIYLEAKIPAERIACLIESLCLDTDYVLTGSKRSAKQFLKYILSASDLEKAEMFIELGQLYRKKHYSTDSDFTDDKGIFIEVRKERY